MTIHAPGRVQTLREKAAGYLQAVSDLEAKVKDPGTHERLQRVRNTLSDVENIFLTQLQRDVRSREQEVRWLGYTEMVLTMAAMQLHEIEDDVAKYGSDITGVG
jgi:hypothetical protein